MKNESDLHELTGILAHMTSASEIHEVLHALLTPREREEIALRWKLVCMLEKGVTQRAIATALGVSLCKITRGSHELKFGPRGFRKAIQRAVGGRKSPSPRGSRGLKG
jgi:TrpR family trp operon transcriptional repressor